MAKRAEDSGPAPSADVPVPAGELDAALRRALRGGSESISTHLHCIKRDTKIAATKTTLHCYFVPPDGNGRPRIKPLAEFLRDQIIDYAIPRRTLEDAFEKSKSSRSGAPISKLHERARRLFTHLAQTGEGGELLLFAMAEAVFGITQIICKMSLKSSTSMHYHGSDGVYAEAQPEGSLHLYWGESKIHADPSGAIRSCLASLAPFLREPEGEDAERDQDILLINEFANFSDETLVAFLKRFLDRDDPASLNLRHCGFALAGFDSAAYSADNPEGTADAIATSLELEIGSWSEAAKRRITAERLESFDIHFICVPLPSADEFRAYFLKVLGVSSDA